MEEEKVKEGLWELAYNLWWTWNPPAKELFRSIDPLLWKETKENPIELLRKTKLLENKLKDENFISHFKYVYSLYKTYMNRHSKYEDTYKKPIVFLSPEYGLHHTLLIYAGGLGFLAGDILKESSDLGFPLIGVGFMYPQGYVKQRIRVDGWQEDLDAQNQKELMPVKKVLDKEGKWLKCYVYVRDEKVYFGVWEVNVGKTKLYLLDTNVEENTPWNREISSRLYVPDKDLRLRQQIVLGFGTVILLEKLGIDAGGFHINEDYPSFVFLAEIFKLLKKGLTWDKAIEEVRKISLFTTHTPLRVAVNTYPFHMIEEQFLFVKDVYGIDVKKVLELGTNPEDPSEGFNSTIMSLRLAKYVNAVSKRHQEVSSKMWSFLFKEKENPIDYVTNGVHFPTWICSDLRRLYEEYLGENFVELHDHKSLWELIRDIPDEELWEYHIRNKERLIEHIKDRARERWVKEKADPSILMAEGLFLDSDVLTVGFARRMTGYKRPDLIFTDVERLKKIVNDSERPVQIIFAGKAHPADIEGKKIIQRIFNFAKDPEFGGRIAFVEDYDELLAHYMVRGVDVWLNNPLPPLEACGTSGMKASMNGVLHLSILDGWWIEGYNGKNGWAFGDYEVEGDRNRADAEAIYNILENEVIPLYYERDERGVPVKWISMMKEAIKSITPNFCSRRMLKDYINKFYSKILKEEG